MQIPALAKKLQSLGLTDKEARVYVAALFLGPSPVQKIAEQAGVNRATTYVILGQLADFGLVSQSNEGKKTVFIAEEPEALDKLFDIQLRQIESRKQEFKKVLPELKKNQRINDSYAPSIRFYKGSSAILDLVPKSLKKARSGSTIYGFTNIDEIGRMFPLHNRTYSAKRIKKNISSKMIYSSHPDSQLNNNKSNLRQVIKIDTPIKADISLYEDRAVFINYNGQDSVGIIIDDQQIVGAMRQLFELAWEKKAKN